MAEVCLVGLFGREYRKLVSQFRLSLRPGNVRRISERAREQGTVENGPLSRVSYVEEGGTWLAPRRHLSPGAGTVRSRRRHSGLRSDPWRSILIVGMATRRRQTAREPALREDASVS